MYTCHSNRAKCRCGTKTWAQPLGSPPSNAPTHPKTHPRPPQPLFSPGCGCFSAYTYVSALRRYQACLMQWTCISISAGQTQINRNVLKKKCFKQIPLQVRQREREGERVQHTNEPISFIWKWTKTVLMKTPRPRREGRGWMDAYLLFDFLQALGNSRHCCHTRQGDESAKRQADTILF